MTEPAESSASRNISLQVLRGIAALLVLVFHAAYFTSQKLTAPWMAEWTIRLGFLGVMVFFVLSGFLMEAAVRRYSVGMFLMHRFLRLFPTYWLVVLLAQWLHHQDNVGFAAMTLLPVGIVPPNPLELAQRPTFELLLKELQLKFDYVIVDTPAIEHGSDARVIAGKCGAALAVVRRGTSQLKTINTMVNAVRKTGTHFAGVVVNEY